MAFQTSWLDLREPADHAARDQELLSAALAHLKQNPVAIDLGAGTGSTIRAFGKPDFQIEWHLVDTDADLLSVAKTRHGDAINHIIDLENIDRLPLNDAGLVTASALFDLLSRDWCERLAETLADKGIGLYAALNYDGAMRWEPALVEDPLITKAFNQHQRRDKGNGPAMGPDAAQMLQQIFEGHGYTVRTAQTPWVLQAPEAELQRQLVTGIRDAAAETGSIFAENWGHARLAACGSSVCTVGHTDVLALPG